MSPPVGDGAEGVRVPENDGLPVGVPAREPFAVGAEGEREACPSPDYPTGPPARPVVTEYRRHRLICPRCGLTTCGSAPVGQDGPRLKAACVLLTGAYRLSKAKAARLLTDLFSIPLCAGQVCATEAEVGQGLRPVVDELLAAARQQPADVDETSMGRRRWLWVTVLP
jgi:hypothetical protein